MIRAPICPVEDPTADGPRTTSKCVDPATERADLTKAMMQYFISGTYGDQYVILTEQEGFNVAINHPTLGWSAWMPQHEDALKKHHAQHETATGFSPFRLGKRVVSTIGFADAYEMMKVSPFRQEAKRLVYSPAGDVRQGELNTFKRFEIPPADALHFAVSNGYIDEANVIDGTLVNDGLESSSSTRRRSSCGSGTSATSSATASPRAATTSCSGARTWCKSPGRSRSWRWCCAPRARAPARGSLWPRSRRSSVTRS